MAKSRARLADEKANPIRYYDPRPTARLFHEDLHKCRILFGANKSGKSYASVAEAVMALTGMNSFYVKGADKFKPPPFKLRCWCVDLKHAAEDVLLPLFQKLTPPRMIDQSRGRGGYNSTKATFFLKNGSEVQFMGYTMESNAGEGVAADAIMLDEPPPERVYNSQWARLLTTRGRMWGAMTPWELCVPWSIAWLHRRIWRRRDGDMVERWRVPIEENAECIDPDVLKMMHQTYSPEERRARLEGHFGRLAGMVYAEFKEDVHAAYDKLTPEELIELARKGHGTIWGGFDYGQRDPTAVIWAYVNRVPLLNCDLAEKDIILFREYKQANRTVQENIAAVRAMTQGVPVLGYFADPSMWKQDPHGGLTIAGDFIAAGVPLYEGNNCKAVGWNEVHKLLRVPPEGSYPSWPRLRMCKGMLPQLEDEILGYCWKPESDRMGVHGDKDMDVNDHLVDSLRYLAVGQPAMDPIVQPVYVPLDLLTGEPATMIARA